MGRIVIGDFLKDILMIFNGMFMNFVTYLDGSQFWLKKINFKKSLPANVFFDEIQTHELLIFEFFWC
jgi:hypothetical protein